MNIVNDDLRHPAVKALLAEHMRGMVEGRTLPARQYSFARSCRLAITGRFVLDRTLRTRSLGSSFAGRSTNTGPIHPAAL
jgi:hypothetical protein